MTKLPPAWWYYSQVLEEEFAAAAQPYLERTIDSIPDEVRRQMLLDVMVSTERRMESMARAIRAQSVLAG